jgi:hypothetical protein
MNQCQASIGSLRVQDDALNTATDPSKFLLSTGTCQVGQSHRKISNRRVVEQGELLGVVVPVVAKVIEKSGLGRPPFD